MPGQLKDGIPVGIGKTSPLPPGKAARSNPDALAEPGRPEISPAPEVRIHVPYFLSLPERTDVARQKIFRKRFRSSSLQDRLRKPHDFPVSAFLDNADPGFFENFTDRRPDKRFRQRITGTGYRLPEAGAIGAFDQQDIQLFRINDDKNRLGNFVSHIQNETREPSRLPFLSQPG